MPSLYNGNLVVEFDEKKHRYLVNGERWQNISSVEWALDCGKSRAFAWWSANVYRDYLYTNWPATVEGDFVPCAVPEIAKGLIEKGRLEHGRKTDEAADVGTQVHRWIEAHIRASLSLQPDPPLPTDEAVRNACLAHLEEEASRRIHYEAVEQIVASREHQVIGTLDKIVTVADTGKRILKDNKTANDVRIPFRIQTAAYAMCWNEEHPDMPVYAREIDLLGKDAPTYEVVDLCYKGMTDEESTRLDFDAFLHCLWLCGWGKRATDALPKRKKLDYRPPVEWARRVK